TPRPLPASLKRKLISQATCEPASTRASITQLPTTALTSIFLSAALENPCRTYIDPTLLSKQSKTTILSLSHVDPLWRAISLNIPELWLHLLISELDADVNEAEYPLYRRKEWLRELFRRSDPLSIDVGGSGYNYLPRDPELVGLELENLHRIRTYRVSLDERGWETLSSCLDESAEVLESVSLAFKPSVFKAPSRFDPGESLAPVPQLPKSIFHGFAPRLSKLSLRGCLPSSGDFSSPLLSNLKSLTVSQVSGPGVPTADRWISYLSTMPRLEHLALEDGAVALRRKQKRNSNPGPVTSAASLQSLCTLTLEGHVEAVGSILARLAFPDQCALSIKCSDVEEGEGAVDVVLRTFARGFEGVATGEDAVRLLSLKADHGIMQVSDGTRNRRLEVLVTNNSHAEPQSIPLWQTLLSRLLVSIPLTIASFTTLEVLLPFIPQALTKSLAGACQLERLVNLTGAMARKLLPLLQKEHHTVGMSPSLSNSNHDSSFITKSDSLSALSPLPILPALHTLHFSSLDAFAGVKWDAVRGFLKWRALGWRAIRLVQAPMSGYGLLGDVEETFEALNVSIIYVH
ncbi:hypothetical protein FA13DRAFT_1737577, partial [Coprinellus micaceus]